MVLLATAATVIASQAVITGAYSVASQAAQLGYLPRLRVVHTSASTIGQIYVPWINGVLMVAVLILVFAFRSSAALAYAFGMAVHRHSVDRPSRALPVEPRAQRGRGGVTEHEAVMIAAITPAVPRA